MINQSSLYLTRIDQFKDNLEGISPESCRQSILEDHRFNNDNDKLTQNLELFEERMLNNRKSSFVCCWHINDKINKTLWDSYGNNSTESIAIETSVDRLNKATENSPVPFLFEPIRYFENPFFNQETYWFPTLFKNKDFEDERE